MASKITRWVGAAFLLANARSRAGCTKVTSDPGTPTYTSHQLGSPFTYMDAAFILYGAYAPPSFASFLLNYTRRKTLVSRKL